MKVKITLLLMALSLSGCLVGPKVKKTEKEPAETFRTSQGDTTKNAAADTTVLKWAQVYEDPALQALIETALKQNFDLLTAMARIDESRATAGVSKADIFPTIGYSAGGSKLNLDNSQANDLGIQQRDLFYGLGLVSWELDIWGKARHGNRSSKAELVASIESHRAVTSSLVAQVASLYFQLRGLDDRLAIAKSTLVLRQEATRIITLRFKGGEVAELDKFQAESQEAIAAALVPSLERDVLQTENALSILIGLPPGAINRGQALHEQRLVEIPAGLPSSLLARRPDVRQAEQQWIAQNERIGVSQAQRFPTISLTGALGIASNDLATLTSNGSGIWNLAAGITGPLFSFNKNKRRVEVERSRTEQSRLKYEKASLTAFGEVEDALIAVSTYAREYEARARQVESTRGAVRLSRERYDNGFTNYLEVLDNERTLLDAELQASTTLQRQLQATVQLYKALGGGWQTN